MGLYNFQPRFVPRIEIGLIHPDDPRAKTHTIRAPRKGGREDKPGNKMHLYTGLRQKGAYRIEARAKDAPPVCVCVESVVIWGGPHWPHRGHRDDEGFHGEVWVGPFLDNVLDDEAAQGAVVAAPHCYGLQRLDVNEVEALARRDGFADFAEMMTFWSGRLPFYGHIFHWRRA